MNTSFFMALNHPQAELIFNLKVWEKSTIVGFFLLQADSWVKKTSFTRSEERTGKTQYSSDRIRQDPNDSKLDFFCVVINF